MIDQHNIFEKCIHNSEVFKIVILNLYSNYELEN